MSLIANPIKRLYGGEAMRLNALSRKRKVEALLRQVPLEEINDAEIAAAVGCSSTYVAQCRSILGLNRKHPRHCDYRGYPEAKYVKMQISDWFIDEHGNRCRLLEGV